MTKVKPVIARTASDLARLLDLDPADAMEMQVRRQIIDKIIEAAQRSGLTHAQLAKAARTSRARLTAILNRNATNVSTDLLPSHPRHTRLSRQNNVHPHPPRRLTNPS